FDSPLSIPLSPLSLCLYGYRPNPHLHSFPTRRSSDLERIRELSMEAGRTVKVEGKDNNLLELIAADSSFNLTLEDLKNAMEPSRDRKSTRLNSSHVSISYAVFCLKKKNNNNTYKYAVL